MVYKNILSLLALTDQLNTVLSSSWFGPHQPKMLDIQINIQQREVQPEQEFEGYLEDDVIQLDKNNPRVFEQKLTDYKDIQLFTDVYIGSQKEAFTMIFDTGSSVLWVDSIKCSNCPKQLKKFDQTKSTTINLGNSYYEWKFYGVGNIKGLWVKDQVCATLDACMPNFDFMLVESQKDLKNLKTSGLVGLAPFNPFIEKLKSSGAMDQAIFSLSIAPLEKESRITFGGYNLAAYGTGPIDWHQRSKHDQQHWALKMNSFELIKEDIEDQNWNINQMQQFKTLMQDQTLIVDSGTSLNLIPKKALTIILQTIAQNTGMKCGVVKNYSRCYCTSDQFDKVPRMKYTIDGKQYILRKSDFLDFMQDKNGNDICRFNFMTSDKYNTWILGLNWFQNYYLIFDIDNDRIGFAPSIHADDKINDKWWFYFKKYSAIVGICIAGCLLYYIWERYDRNQEEKRLRELEENRQLEEAILASENETPNQQGPNSYQTNGQNAN